MKILALRFKNLNSLYGEWIIDFSDFSYTSSGIFALTGPTGSGKSTLLDAICLALYGRTPRLSKVTKSENEIMSRQTGECYAEVLFESQAGRFRCHWEHRRSRKKVSGNLLPPEHQIIDASSGQPIETKRSRVSQVVEKKTGMNFERFTRSILLAQGGFDKFLRAEEDSKSSILEQITGTRVYSDISIYTHKRQREEKTKLNNLEAEIAGIKPLESDKVHTLQKTVASKKQQATSLEQQIIDIREGYQWRQTIRDLTLEIDTLAAGVEKVENELTAFKPQRDTLNQAMKAVTLERVYAVLTTNRKQLAAFSNELTNGQSRINDLKAKERVEQAAVEMATKKVTHAKDLLKKAKPVIQKVRSLDQSLFDKKSVISAFESSYKQKEATLNKNRTSRQKNLEAQKKAETKQGLINDYLTDHKHDKRLISDLGKIELQLEELAKMQVEMAERKTIIRQVEADLKKTDSQTTQQKQQFLNSKKNADDAEKQFQKTKDKYTQLLKGRLLREYRTEKDHLQNEMIFLSKIAQLEEHRKNLKEGTPCPLCGSESHPYTNPDLPRPDHKKQRLSELSKLIKEAEQQEQLMQTYSQTLAAAQRQSEATHIQAEKANAAMELLKNEFSRLTHEQNVLTEHIDEAKASLLQTLKPYAITQLGTNHEGVINILRQHHNSFQAKVEEKILIDQQINDHNSQIKHLDGTIDEQERSLTQDQEHLDQLKQEFTDKTEERKKLLGTKKADEEEAQLTNNLAIAEDSVQHYNQQFAAVSQQLISIRDQNIKLKQIIEQKKSLLQKEEMEFNRELLSVGFDNEEAYLAAISTPEQRHDLTLKAKALDEKYVAIKAKQEDRQSRLTAETQKNKTDKSLDNLQSTLKQEETQLHEIHSAIAELNQQLLAHEQVKEQVEEKRKQVVAQKAEFGRWAKLHHLIGSENGKKYRTFAQGVTLELMITHANIQLQKMTERYLLVRAHEKPLELSVIDNFQAGEIRSTRNLSGGESFIISLALALGLSKIASRNVRVDSLFLDEGFGTLDENALEVALETLSGLQHENKVIGVISHVARLQEQISTQIKVIPIAGGRSRLEGPGCLAI